MKIRVGKLNYKSLSGQSKPFGSDEAGVTSTEMVIAASLFLVIFFWMIETGLIMIKWVMLERGVDLAARQLRISGLPEDIDPDNNVETHNYIKDLICANTLIVDDCDTNLFVQLDEYDANVGILAGATTCINRTGPVDPDIDLPGVDAGSRAVADADYIMYMRACIVVDPILPANYSMPLPLDASGGVALVVDSAFVNEPE